MRSLADGLEVLRKNADFSANDRATVGVYDLQVPSREIASLVRLDFNKSPGSIVCCVYLPAAVYFRAIEAGTSVRRKFTIAQLAGAVVNDSGQVRLKDGRNIRGVDVVPALLKFVPSDLEWQIVLKTIDMLGLRDQCGREYPPSSGRYRLDCSKLGDLKLPNLNILVSRFYKTNPEFRNISQQKFADALASFGIRIPKKKRTHSPVVTTPTLF